jgi:hypothetical protein
MNKTIETISCKVCSDPMPKLRKELYGYDFCVKCSTVMPKVGRVVTYGQGEDTWNDLEIMDQETAKRILELEQLNSSVKFDESDLLDFNQDLSDNPGYKYRVVGAVSEIVNKFDIPDMEIIHCEIDEESLDDFEDSEVEDSID